MAISTIEPRTDVERIRTWRIWFALGIVIAIAGLGLMMTVAAGIPGAVVLLVGLIVAAAAYSRRPTLA